MSFNADLLYQKYVGQSLSYDGIPANRGQCVQWAEYVLTDSQYGYGLAPFYGNAIDWWNNYGGSLTAFDKITDGSIKKGDIVIFNQNVGSVYGHIDMALQDGSVDQFLGADSNWAGNLTVHQVNHVGRQYVLGSLRLKGGTMDLFNDGDRKNWLTEAYVQDVGQYSELVGKVSFKEAIEKMRTDGLLRTNQGDVINGFNIFNAKPSPDDLGVWVKQPFKKFQYEKIADGVAKMPPQGVNPYSGPELFVKE